MSQRLLIGCDYQGCEARAEVIKEPLYKGPSEELRGWRCLMEPSMMNREIDLCPEHAKLLTKEVPDGR